VTEIESALHAHFGRHNRRVVTLSALTFAAALVLWAGLYVVAQWLTLLAAAAIAGESTPLPPRFPAFFSFGAAALMGLAVIDRWLTRDERVRDEKSGAAICMDFVLAIPRVTLDAWGTLRAWQHLSPSELALAAAFIERLAGVSRLPLHAAAIELPDPSARAKILFALQLTQVIAVQRRDGEFCITLDPLQRQSLRLPAGD
jgi:hypothetical protein